MSRQLDEIVLFSSVLFPQNKEVNVDALQGFRDRYRGGQFVRKEASVELRGVIDDVRVMEGSLPLLIEIIGSDVRERTTAQGWYPADALGVVVEDTFEIAGDIEQALDVVTLSPVRFLPPGHPECIDFAALPPRRSVVATYNAHPFESALVGTLFSDGFMHVLWLEPLPEASPRFAIADKAPREFRNPIAVNMVSVSPEGVWRVTGTGSLGDSTFPIEGTGRSFWAALADALLLTDDWQHAKPAKPLCSLPK